MRNKLLFRTCALALIVLCLTVSLLATGSQRQRVDAVQPQVPNEGIVDARLEDQDRLGLTERAKSTLSDIIFTLLISVKAISPGSAADNAGLRPGDYIFRFDGVSMRGIQTLRALETAAPGTIIDIEYGRPGPNPASFTRFHAQVPLGIARRDVHNLEQTTETHALPFDAEYVDQALLKEKKQRSFLGMSGNVLMLLTYVEPGSPADRAGLKPGDMITEIDGLPVRGVQTVRAAQLQPPGTLINIVYLRSRPDDTGPERASTIVALSELNRQQ